MLIYKILRPAEFAELIARGESAGAPVDRVDGFVHFSTGAQVRETAARHFSGEDGLWLVACDGPAFGSALRWEVSRGGAAFPHLYRVLRVPDILWARPLPLGAAGHCFPEDMAGG